MDAIFGQMIDGYYMVKTQLMTNCPCLNGETSNPAGYPPAEATMQMRAMAGEEANGDMPAETFANGGFAGNTSGFASQGDPNQVGANPFIGAQQSTDDEEFNEFGSSEQITEWQAGWNVTNAIQGMFIVSLPYAVLHGGWWGVLVLIFCAYICCYTGKILVACLYEVDANGQWVRVRDSYVGIAKTVMGEQWGGKLVNIAQNIELLMTCILYIVLCGELMIGSFPEAGIDQASWMMISAILLLPCAFLKDLHAVSTLSFWCGISHIVINVIILGYCFLQIGDWHYSEV
jgi:vesicular inhibitory amino acid transporter